MKILITYGTRPEWIKVKPLIDQIVLLFNIVDLIGIDFSAGICSDYIEYYNDGLM